MCVRESERGCVCVCVCVYSDVVEATIGGGGGLVVGRQCCLVAVAPHNHNLQRGTAPMAAALAGTLVDKSFQLPQGPGGIK